MRTVATFIIALVVFLIIIDVFTILFRLTGMPVEKARFQVISLLTGTGYTTKEAEIITQHPTRRKIASALMIISYVSTLTFISFLVNILSKSLINAEFVLVLTAFIVLSILFFKSPLLGMIENIIEGLIEKSPMWKHTQKKYLTFIKKHKGYCICEIYLKQSDDLVGKTVKDSKLSSIEIMVLSIDKGEELINFPKVDYIFEENDKLTVYGNIHNIKEKFRKY